MLDNLFIRYSNEEDEQKIRKILYENFGEMVEQQEAYKDAKHGKFLLAFSDKTENELIALSGFCKQDQSDFGGIEITWSCTKKEYRHNGIMQELFKRLIASTDENIFCNCWKIDNNENVNLQSLMNIFDFKKLKNNYKARTIHNCNYSVGCPFKHDNCNCSNDIYIRS